jgi:hypothetical protein
MPVMRCPSYYEQKRCYIPKYPITPIPCLHKALPLFYRPSRHDLGIIHMTRFKQELQSNHGRLLAVQQIYTLKINIYQQVLSVTRISQLQIVQLFDLALQYLERRQLVTHYL